MTKDITVPVSSTASPASSGWVVPWRIRDAAVIYIVAWFVMPAVAFFAAKALIGKEGDALQDLNIAMSLYVIAITVFVGLTWYLRRSKASWHKLGLVRPNHILKAAGWALLGLVAYWAASAGLYWLSQALGVTSAAGDQAKLFGGQTSIVFIVGLALVAPIAEELFFRGFLLPTLAKKWGFVIGGVLGSSLLFGIVHGLAVGPTAFVLGVIMVLLYKRTNSILPGIALHIVINIFSASQLVLR